MKLNKKGFTLVELLAVIVILALLMVVATRTIGTSLTTSKTKAMQTELTKLATKTYEDANANALLGGTPTFTYGTAGTKAEGKNDYIYGNDGNYKFIVEYGLKSGSSNFEIKRVCITDGTYGYDSKTTNAASGIANGDVNIINGTSFEYGTSWSAITKCEY